MLEHRKVYAGLSAHAISSTLPELLEPAWLRESGGLTVENHVNPKGASEVWEWVRCGIIVAVTLLAPFLEHLIG